MKLNIQANNAPRGERPNFIGTGKPPFRPIVSPIYIEPTTANLETLD